MSSPTPEPHETLAQRLLPELGASGHVDIPAVPVPPDDDRGWLAVPLPSLSALGTLGFALLSPNVLVIALGGGFALVSVLGAVVAGRHRRRRHEQTWAVRCEHYRAQIAASACSLAEAARRERSHANRSSSGAGVGSHRGSGPPGVGTAGGSRRPSACPARDRAGSCPPVAEAGEWRRRTRR